MTSQNTAKVPDTGRWWLPGPPPYRRQVSIESVELSGCADELAGQPVAIRRVDLWSMHNRTTPTMQDYFERQCKVTPMKTRGLGSMSQIV